MGFDLSSLHEKLKVQSHDTAAPSNLVEFMLKDWRTPSTGRLKPLKDCANFKTRREALSKLFPGELLLIPCGHEKVRANDTFFAFRPSSDFYYLTGATQRNCVLAMVPEDLTHRAVFFIQANAGKTDSTFFSDRVNGELWAGPRLGVDSARVLYDINDTRALGELEEFLKDNVTKSSRGHRIVTGHSAELERWMGLPTEEQANKNRVLAIALSEMRLIKDDLEIREISGAIEATHRGFEDMIRRMKTAKSERELEGEFYTRARVEGNDVGYRSIVASGAHACTLHWSENSGALRKNDLLLLDCGVEAHSLYTADVTRTIPISGKFSKEQREIYDIVLAAHNAAIRQVVPGNDFLDPNRAAMNEIATGLEELGILPMSADEALKDQNQFYKRYSLHGVSHMLGLDVHDCASARSENYRYGKLLSGMVLTVEPGLYFQPDDLTVPAKYRGIGIRIEDDILVTKKGHRILSASLPTQADEIEKWIRSLWKKK